MTQLTISFVLLFAVLFPHQAPAFLQTYAITGDAGRWNPSAQKVRDSILQNKINQLILTGDNHYDAGKTYDDIWRPWKQKGFEFVLVALGNHTLTYKDEIKYFHMPAEYYARTSADTRWIVLNSDNENNAAEQMRFLESQLIQAKESLIFIVLHHPTYTISKFHPWTEKAKFQIPFRQLLWKYQNRIAALLVGHDHLASLVSLNGIPMVVSGAIQEQRVDSPVHYTEDGVQVSSVWLYRGEPHWARLDVISGEGLKTEVWTNFINANMNSVSCSARIFPRPILLRSNCAKTTQRLKFW